MIFQNLKHHQLCKFFVDKYHQNSNQKELLKKQILYLKCRKISSLEHCANLPESLEMDFTVCVFFFMKVSQCNVLIIELSQECWKDQIPSILVNSGQQRVYWCWKLCFWLSSSVRPSRWPLGWVYYFLKNSKSNLAIQIFSLWSTNFYMCLYAWILIS